MTQPRITAVVAAYVAALLLIAAIRAATGTDSPLAALSPFATWLYIGTIVVAINALPRAGISIDRLGFTPFRLQHLWLGLIGMGVIFGLSWGLAPLWEQLPGGERDLSRFDGLEGSPAELAKLLAMSWTFAAFGEELAFRILLLQGLIAVLGNSRGPLMTAVVLQALVFGLVHAYQGPVGVVQTFTNGLVYGAITVRGGNAIWPAALAHGLGNTLGLTRLYLGY
ncbi:MAG: CPBP family intramembrane glutamic endopeptidase [Halieaceae bacterium]|jgi:membrane protease YdiL (CAAX protease family)|nr:CPBP family intramembrane glutamic endopeptidase [Halieaceae bacterium]